MHKIYTPDFVRFAQNKLAQLAHDPSNEGKQRPVEADNCGIGYPFVFVCAGRFLSIYYSGSVKKIK